MLPSLGSDPQSRLSRVIVASRDSKARTYKLKLDSLERASRSEQGSVVSVKKMKPEHVLNAHRTPILCMDCCTVPEHAVVKAGTIPSLSERAPEATADIVALGSAGAAFCSCLV